MSKRPDQTMIMSANALLDGDVVYYARGGIWSPNLSDAVVAMGDSEAAALEAARASAVTHASVVDPEIVPVATDAAGRLVPSHYREKIRALGPTIRTDLGPQAAGENLHVSL